MKHPELRLILVALSLLTIAACGDQVTQPDGMRDEPAVTPLAVAHNTWLTRRNMLLQRARFVAAMVPNAAGQSIVYAIGGKKQNDSVSVRQVQAYNAATNTWSRKADLPIALRDQNGASVIGGKIYVAGGITGTNTVTKLLYVYNPATNTWARKSDMPAPGAGGATGVINDKLYVLASRSFFRYNPVTDHWIRLAAPDGRFGTGAVLYDKFYALGDGANNRLLVMYDPTTNSWSTKARPPFLGLDFGDAISLEAKMYVIGFELLGTEALGMATWVYSPLSNTWSQRTPPPEAVGVASRVFVDGRPRLEAMTGWANLQYVP